MGKKFKEEIGSPYPLGATPDKKGVNFSVFSQNATGVELLVFENDSAKTPFYTIKLDPEKNKTYNFWHVYLRGLKSGHFYAYRVDGPDDLQSGHRFNKKKVLIDPYTKGVDYALWKKEDALTTEDNLATSLRGAIIDTEKYDWGKDRPLGIALDDTIVYELHVGNFTKHSSSKTKYAGKFAGIVEKLPYIKSLGVTAVELMPIFEFDSGDPKNTWGYGTTSFFAPESSYCLSPNQASQVDDFRNLVRSIHKAGMEVILDVVFGYTTEGDNQGPILSFKGFDNSIYYRLSPDNKEFYMNYSGCGNTFNANHPIVSKFIVDCLEYWVKEMHVDGFRFDLASILARDENGNLDPFSHVLWNIDLSPTLVNTKIFAEPWDATGGYLVGKFPGYRFIEWNGRFRDDMRRFIRGDYGMVQSVASRLTGSADLYQSSGHLPQNSLNFITSHDGFTMYDLVSYNQKHNEANGEDNRDGLDDNCSWNCGVEGETDNAFVNHLRMKQIKNFFAILFLAKGVPMILAGDEVARTQKGNNNAYCQDNEIAWFDWDLIKKNNHLLQFVRRMIELRKKHRFLHDNDLFVNKTEEGWPEIKFHGCKINNPGWNMTTRVLAYTIRDKFHVMMNMEDKHLEFDLPKVRGRWHIVANTADDGVGASRPGDEKSISSQEKLLVDSKSIVVLIAK